jgi:hypothetical protein
MAVFRSLCVNLRDFLCDIPRYASEQFLDLTRGRPCPWPFGSACGASYFAKCEIVLDLAEKLRVYELENDVMSNTSGAICGWAPTAKT